MVHDHDDLLPVVEAAKERYGILTEVRLLISVQRNAPVQLLVSLQAFDVKHTQFGARRRPQACRQGMKQAYLILRISASRLSPRGQPTPALTTYMRP